MGLQNWRWWRWAIVSLLVGGLVGFVLTRLDPDDASIDATSWPHFRFGVDGLTESRESVYTRIRVGPVVTNAYGKSVRSVTYWERMRSKSTGRWDPVRQYRVITDVPLSPASPRPDFSVLDFLAEKKKTIPSLDYRYEWWWEPRNVWISSFAGSVLLIGVLWPMVLSGMVAVGWAEPPEEGAMDLSQVSSATASARVPTGRAVSAAERAKLDALNDAMAAGLGDLIVSDDTEITSDRPPTEAVVKPLVADTAGTAPTAKGDEKPHDYTGEYYPVVRPGTKE